MVGGWESETKIRASDEVEIANPHHPRGDETMRRRPAGRGSAATILRSPMPLTDADMGTPFVLKPESRFLTAREIGIFLFAAF
jgi:hypothetical protein